MGTGRFRVPAGAMNWGIAVSVAVLLLGTGLSGQHPGGERGLFGAVLLAVAVWRWPRVAGLRLPCWP